jgi:hypothetical protein
LVFALIKIDTISFEEYRSIILKHRGEMKWFYWSIQKDRGMSYLAVLYNNEIAGVVAIMETDRFDCEILIENQNRRKGIASLAIRELQNRYNRLTFKVSRYNLSSLAFFRSLSLPHNDLGEFVEFYSE